MNIALIGYGVMGQLVAELAKEKEYDIAIIFDHEDVQLTAQEIAERLQLARADVVIDFSSAQTVLKNIRASVLAGVPIVEGTTGWNEHLDTVKKFVEQNNGALVYGANFSVGVNLFYRVADFAAALFAKFADYETFIEEQHHSRKKDAPSGTALKLKAIVERHFDKDFTVTATRAGNIPGTHRVGFDGAADQILLEHTARSREGFAAGALLAAEWIADKKGVYEFANVMDEILNTQK